MSPLKVAITVLAKHHGDSIVIFHSESTGKVGWDGMEWGPLSGSPGNSGDPASISALKAAITVLAKHHGDCRGFA